MGQQPNIELEISDLPRPQRRPDPARGWVPDRPGELGGPEDMQFGEGFGTIGPDAGYAMSLVKARSFELADGEHRSNTEAGLAAVASARSALFRRGPTGKDVDVAMILLGFDPATPDALKTTLGESRVKWFAAAGHHATNLFDFVASLDADVLRLTADEARSRLAQGTSLITH